MAAFARSSNFAKIGYDLRFFPEVRRLGQGAQERSRRDAEEAVIGLEMALNQSGNGSLLEPKTVPAFTTCGKHCIETAAASAFDDAIALVTALQTFETVWPAQARQPGVTVLFGSVQCIGTGLAEAFLELNLVAREDAAVVPKAAPHERLLPSLSGNPVPQFSLTFNWALSTYTEVLSYAGRGVNGLMSAANSQSEHLRPRIALNRVNWNAFFTKNVSLIILLVLYSFLYFYTTTFPGRSSLGHDEIWGATNSNLSFLDAIIFTLRFDVHPPLYYSQLNLWAIFGRSDFWLQANSVFWLLGTAAVAFHFVRMRGSNLSAIIAAGFILSNPMLMISSVTVRMYTLLPFLTMTSVLFADGLAKSQSSTGTGLPSRWWMLFLVQSAIIYTHVLGVLIVGSTLLYMFVEAGGLKASRPFLKRLLVMAAGLAGAAIPVAANSAIRLVSHSRAPSANDVLSTLLQLVAGPAQNSQAVSATLLFAVVISVVTLAVAISRDARSLILCFVVFPMTASIVISHAYKPIWLTYTYTFCVPVVAVSIGLFADDIIRSAGTLHQAGSRFGAAASALALVAAFSTFGIWNAQAEKTPNYPSLVADIRRAAQPDDCVVATTTFDVFWGLSRYFAGPRWNQGLEVQAAPIRRWNTIIAKVPEGLARRLKLIARSDRFKVGDIWVVDGYPNNLQSTCGRVFFAVDGREEAPVAAQSAPLFSTSGYVSIRGPINPEEAY